MPGMFAAIQLTFCFHAHANNKNIKVSHILIFRSEIEAEKRLLN